MDESSDSLSIAFKKALYYVGNQFENFLKKNMEIGRCIYMASVLKDIDLQKHQSLLTEFSKRVLNEQQKDGGWKNVEETIWCAHFLKKMQLNDSVQKAYVWLQGQRSKEGGWGQSERDISRVRLTSLMLLFHEEIFEVVDMNWLSRDLKKEIFDSPNFFLTYKASLPIMAFKKSQFEIPYLKELSALLLRQQNPDGGFSPWKNHPAKSDILCTSVALNAIIDEENCENAIRKTIEWIISTQLVEGGWPYHFIEHGASFGLSSLFNAYKNIHNL